MSEATKQNDSSILLEGPPPSDAAFYGRWLLAAVKAQELWETIQSDTKFDALHIGAIPDLCIGAMQFVACIKAASGIISLRPTEGMVELAIMTEFVMLAEIGLFTLTGDRYQFTEPAGEPSVDKLKAIALKLEASREIELEHALIAYNNSLLYPRQLITAISKGEARWWQWRLDGMDQACRAADRTILLENDIQQP